MSGRPEQPEPFLQGCAFGAGGGVAYPRADPADSPRLPVDTWATAQIPVSVRLELVGDAPFIHLGYRTATGDLGYRGDGAGRTFSLWRDGVQVDEVRAVLGEGDARLAAGGPPESRAIVYLPEGMRPVVESISGVGGTIEPASAQPRWLAYGDSVAEGWVASAPCLAWPAVAGRDQGLDVVNLGYAGAARGEIASAEQIATVRADVISITYGTNCWSRTPFSESMMSETFAAFVEIVRQGHPRTPVVVASPVLRPDAERTPNRLGATLADLRRAIEDVTRARIASGDARLELVPGAGLLSARHLADGIHPGDEGHRELASRLGPAIASACSR